MNEAFSTGSQNHQPPQPSSLYAHQEPSVMPIVRNSQAVVVHGRVQRAHAASSRPEISAAIANANATENPTYHMYSIGGWTTNPGSWSSGLSSRPLAGTGTYSTNELEVGRMNNKK